VAAHTSAASAHAEIVSPNEIECRSRLPASPTTQNDTFCAGTSAAPSLISARTGVTAVVPMISAEVISAPIQRETSMISWPATPGKKYLLPPEMPTTSCGRTGPTTSAMSCSIRTDQVRCPDSHHGAATAAAPAGRAIPLGKPTVQPPLPSPVRVPHVDADTSDVPPRAAGRSQRPADLT
jgi:hypothetical protein